MVKKLQVIFKGGKLLFVMCLCKQGILGKLANKQGREKKSNLWFESHTCDI